MVATTRTVKLVSAAFLVLAVTVAIIVPLMTRRNSDNESTKSLAIPSPAPNSTTPLESLSPTDFDDTIVDVAPSATQSPGNVFQHETIVPTSLNDNSNEQPSSSTSEDRSLSTETPTSTTSPTILPFLEDQTTLVPTPTLPLSIAPMKTTWPTVILDPEQVLEPTVTPIQAPSTRPLTVPSSSSSPTTTSAPSTITDSQTASTTEPPTNIPPAVPVTPGVTAIPMPETLSSELPFPVQPTMSPQTLPPVTFPNTKLPTNGPTSTPPTPVPLQFAPTTSPFISLTADPSWKPNSAPSMTTFPSTSPSRPETISPALHSPSLSPDSLLPTEPPTIARSNSLAPYPIPTDLFVGSANNDTEPFRWFQLGEAILGTSSANADDLGESMAMNANGTIIAVGAPQFPGCASKESSGYVQVRHWNVETFQWELLGNQLSGRFAEDEFGKTVALSSDGMVLAVGAPQTKKQDYGYVTTYRYDKESNTWNQLGIIYIGLYGSLSRKEFGSALAMSASGETIVVGCKTSSPWKMMVQVFRFDAVTGQYPRLGQIFFEKSPHLGISASGSVVSMGSKNQDSTEIFQFDKVSGLWTLLGVNTVPGRAKTLSGNGLVVATDRGIFQYLESTSQWEQLGDSLEQALYDQVSFSYDGFTMAYKSSFKAFCRLITGPDVDEYLDSPTTSPASSASPATFSPTGSSAAPSDVPSVAPSQVPSASPSLSVFPSESPTMAPTDPLYGPYKECEMVNFVRIMRYNSTSFQWERLGRDLRIFSKCLRSTVLSDNGLTLAVSGQPEVGYHHCKCGRGSVYVITTETSKVSQS